FAVESGRRHHRQRTKKRLLLRAIEIRAEFGVTETFVFRQNGFKFVDKNFIRRPHSPTDAELQVLELVTSSQLNERLDERVEPLGLAHARKISQDRLSRWSLRRQVTFEVDAI